MDDLVGVVNVRIDGGPGGKVGRKAFYRDEIKVCHFNDIVWNYIDRM